MTEIGRIKEGLEKAFYGGAWHGPSVLETLEDITAETAFAKPISGAHSIWEIVLHLNTWQIFTLKRISGEKYNPSPEEDWPEIPDNSQSSWENALNALQSVMKELSISLTSFNEKMLDEIVPGKNYTYYTALHGLIEHDIYHAGQILILKKALQ